MICISTQIQTSKDRRNTGTLHHLLLCSSWYGPVHVIHLFHARRIPDPWLHFAYLIVLWFSHALFGRKPVRSVCPQLCKILRETSTICSQTRTIARWSPPLLSQTRLWTPATHLHLPSQHPKLGIRPYCCLPKQQMCLHFGSIFSFLMGEGVMPWPWPTLRGQKDTETQGVSMKFWRKVG